MHYHLLMLPIVEAINTEVENAQSWLLSELNKAKKELVGKVDLKWKTYQKALAKYNSEKTAFDQLDEGETKETKRELLDALIDGRLRNLNSLKEAVGELDTTILAEFDINLPVDNKRLDQEINTCLIDRKKLYNMPIPVNSEEELEDELAYMYKQHKAFKTFENSFKVALDAYNKDHSDTPLSVHSSDQNIAKAQFKVKELGKKALSLISNLNGRVKEVSAYADMDMIAETDTYAKDPRILANIQIDNRRFTQQFMAATRAGKPKAVTVDTDKVKDSDSLQNFLKEDENNLAKALPSDEILESFNNAMNMGDEHELALNAMNLLIQASKINKVLLKKDIADRIENLRQRLYKLRNDMQIWLQEYSAEIKKEDLDSVDAETLKKLQVDISKTLPLLQKNLIAIGSYAVLHNNFPNLIVSYNKLMPNVSKALEFKEELEALKKFQNRGDNKEELEIKVKEFAKQKTEIKTDIEKFAQEASDWCEQHTEKDFGLALKREELQDKTRDLFLRANDLNITNIQTDQFTALADVLPKGYNYDKDSLRKKVASKVQTLKGLEEGGHHKKRFTKLGDLNNLLQEWEHKYRYYNRESSKESDDKSFAKAYAEIQEANKYFKHQYEVINALMSIGQLGGAMKKDIKKYSKMVVAYNDSPEKYTGDFPTLLAGSNRLLEFIKVWNSQYDKAQSNLQELGQQLDTPIQEQKKEFDKLKNIIEHKNLSIITGMRDFDKLDELSESLKSAEAELKNKTQDHLEKSNKLAELKVRMRKLKKAKPVDEEKVAKLELRIKRYIKNTKTLSSKIKQLEKSTEDLKTKEKHKREQLEKDRPDASSIFTRLSKAYEDTDSFIFAPDLDTLQYSERWQTINYILGLVDEWRKMVIDPKAENLVVYKKAVDGIEADLLRQRAQFQSNKAYEDKLYPRIKKAWEIVAADLKNKKNDEEALLQLNYCKKLLSYWFKENKAAIKSEEEKRKELIGWKTIVEKEIEGDRFKLLKKREGIKLKLDDLNNLIKTIRDDISARNKEILGNSIYNVNNPEGEAAVTDWIQNFSKLVDRIQRKKEKEAEKALEEDRLEDANTLLISLLNELSEAYSNSQIELTKLVQKSEALVFAGLGDGDYDYENSGSFSPEQIDLMNKTMSNAVARATAMLESGANLSEVQQAVAHLPSSMLPDKFIEQLNAFRITEKAFQEEQNRAAEEEAAKALGLSDILLDVDTGKQLSEITGALTDLNGLTTFKKWSEGDAGYDDLTVFSNESQSQGHKSVGNVLDYLDAIAGSLEDFENLRNLPKEERQKEVADFLFNGGIDFEDEDGDLKQSTTSKTKVKQLEMSQRKRIILLSGMNFISKVSGLIDSTADAYDGSKVLQAFTKNISFFVGKLASIIDEGSSPETVARTTQALWDERINVMTDVAQALLASGSTIAQTAQLFTQLPTGIMPGLNIATGAINLAINIKGIAEKMLERHRTKALMKEAEIYDRSYIGPLKQEISSLNRRIAKQSVEAATDVMMIAAGITSAAGHPEAGAAIAIVAGVMKLGNKLVFEGINEAMLKEARDTLKKARGGDRKAQIKIFEKSPVYAKMFIAIGCTKEPADPIALEFVRQRGITERDLKDAGTSKYIVRRFIRKKLLEHAEEADSHDGKLGIFKGLAAKWKAWRLQVNTKKGFWNGTQQNYETLLQVYPGAKLHKLVDDAVKACVDVPQDVLDFWEVDSYIKLPFFEDIKAIYQVLSEQQSFAKQELRLKKRELDEEIDKDKNDSKEDHAPIIQRIEQTVDDLETQVDELNILITTLENVENTEFKFN